MSMSEVDLLSTGLDKVKARLELMLNEIDENSSLPTETYDRLAEIIVGCEELNEYVNTYSSYDPG